MTSPPTQTHPDLELLRQFDSGELRGPTADTIEAHLETCVECCQTLRGLSVAPLVQHLRVAEGLTQVPEPSTPAAPAELRDHPRYRILDLVGKGGMGAVYRAEHRLMKRTVALKVLDRSFTARPEMVERFRHEVQAAAHLTHPHIVQAFDAEQAGEVHFLVMEFIHGTDLARLTAARGRLSVAEACSCVRQAALGLQHAFEHGMTHRDVKPHNLILTAAGIVKVLDFGLARLNQDAGAATGVTSAGMILGTADYMAPEQADNPHTADVRSDIYALGCTLYHLLTGQVPFPGGGLSAKLRAHAEKEPPRVCSVQPDVPDELSALVARMLAKSPSQRPATPAEVAETLAPFATVSPSLRAAEALAPAACAGTPTAADLNEAALPTTPPTPPLRPRRRLLPLALAALAAVLLAGALYRIQTDKGELVIAVLDEDVEVVIKQNGQVVDIADTKTKKRWRLSPGAYDLGLKGADGLQLDVRQVTIRRGEAAIARVERVDKFAEKPPEPPDRSFDPPPGLVRRFLWLGGPIVKPALSRDGRYLAVAPFRTGPRLGAVYDLRDGSEVFQFPSHGLTAFTPDGNYLIADHEGNHLALFRLAHGKKERALDAQPHGISDLFVSPDSRFAIASGANLSTMWNLRTGTIELTRRWGTFFSVSGRQLIAYSLEGTEFQLLHADDHRPAGKVPQAHIGDAPVALLPDGRTLLRCNDQSRQAELWDATTGQKGRAFDLGARFLTHERFDQHFEYGAVSPEGKRLLTSHSDGYLRLWELATGREVWRIPVESEMRGLTFSADGRFVAAGTVDGSCSVWRLPNVNGPYPASPKTLRQSDDGTREHEWNVRLYHSSYSSNGQYYLATGDWNNQVRVWSAATGELVQVVPGKQWARFTPDGTHVLACGPDLATIRTWNVTTGQEVLMQRLRHARGVGTFEVSDDGARVLASSVDGTIHLWDLPGARELGKVTGQPAWPRAVFSPAGNQALSQGADGTVLLWELPRFKLLRQWKVPKSETVVRLQFLPKAEAGRIVVVTSQAVHWFAPDAAEPVRPALPHRGQPGSTGEHEWWLSLSPDGRQLVAMNELSLRVLELPSGKERARFEASAELFEAGKGSPFRLCSVSPDGRWLIAPAEHIARGVGRLYRFPLPRAP